MYTICISPAKESYAGLPGAELPARRVFRQLRHALTSTPKLLVDGVAGLLQGAEGHVHLLKAGYRPYSVRIYSISYCIYV